MSWTALDALNSSGADDEYCRPQAEWSFLERCDYVRAADACGGGGYLQWTAFVYCDEDEVGKWIVVVVGILFFLFLFLMLSTSADDFFCPNISTIVNKLSISENLAGVTFMAFGNGAPDVFTSLASVVSSPSPRADLALGSLLGGALFVTLFVLAGVILVRPFKAATFSTLRDLSFFMITMGFILSIFLVSDQVTIWQPLVCIGIYIVYVLTVIITEFVKKRKRRRTAETANSNETETETPPPSDLVPGDPDHKSMDRLDTLKRSSIRVSRRSVVIPSFSGTTHAEIVIEEDEDETPDDFIIREQEHTRRHKLSINQKIVHGTKGVVADILSYLAPQFEDDEPSKFQIVKTYILFPIVTLFKLTVPLSTANWSKPMAIILSVVSPQCFIFNTQLIYTIPIEGGPGLYAYAPIISIPLIVFILATTTMDQEPRFYRIIFSLAGFVMSVSWMYCISNEVVDAVTMIGVVTGIDQAILGLTVISWANCVGDLVSDSSVARQGFPRMGMAAATGGPLFNVLIGFGLPFTIAILKEGSVPISLNSTSLIMITFMFISFIFTSVNLIIFRGRLTRIHGIILIAIYLSFIVFVILSATGVLVWINTV